MAKIATNGALSKGSGTGTTTLTVVTQAPNNLRTLACMLNSTPTVTTVTGGGVSLWQRAITSTINGVTSEIWWGTCDSTTAPTTITVGWSASITSTIVEYGSQMWKSDRLIPRWWCDNANSHTGASSTTLTWPTLTPDGGIEMMFGCSFVGQTGSVGSTSGYAYSLTSNDNVLLQNPNISAATTPTASQSPSGNWSTVGALFGVTDAFRPPLNQAVNRGAYF